MSQRRAARRGRGTVPLPLPTVTVLLWSLGLMALAACDEGPKSPEADPAREVAEDSSAAEAVALSNLALELGLDLTRGLSPDARVDTYAALREDLETPRHPADGGGRAWLESVRAYW